MNAAAWDVEEPEPQPAPAPPQSALLSLHFVRAALHRRRRTALAGALIGVLLAGLFLYAVPASYTAQTTLVLSHDANEQADTAMATDTALATTRDVAQQTIQVLGLAMTTHDLLSTVSVEPTTSSILTITLTAPTGDEAVDRLAAFTSAYLSFRSKQLAGQSDALAAGLNQRIASLQQQTQTLTNQIEILATRRDAASSSQLNDAVAQRSQFSSQITTLQESLQDAKLQTASLIASSRVIDAPATLPSSPLIRAVIVLAAGLIGGAGLAAALVVLAAITSDRIRFRAEVAAMLEVPVAASGGRIAPLPSWLRRWPIFRAIDARRSADRQRVASAIMAAVPASGSGQWLAVACIDNASEMVFGVAEAAAGLQRRGGTIRLIDLTERGHLHAAVARLRPFHDLSVPVLRPRGIPSLASDMNDIEVYGPRTSQLPALRETDVFLSISDLTPSLGAAHLAAWTQRVVIGVTSGRSSVERLRTAADLVQAAGLSLWSAVLLGAETSDDSSGAYHPERVSS